MFLISILRFILSITNEIFKITKSILYSDQIGQEKDCQSGDEADNDHENHVIEVAGGHKISAKKVSVSTISVTFTDEIDAYTNHLSDTCCKNHGDRTAIIDLLAVSGSSQCNKGEHDLDNKILCLPECCTNDALNMNAKSNTPCLKESNKSVVNISNGVPPNQVVHGINHICNRYSGISEKHGDTISTSSTTTIGSKHKQLMLNPSRTDSNKSLTLNHRYCVDQKENNVELNVYRYDGWHGGICQTSCNGTKSTLV